VSIGRIHRWGWPGWHGRGVAGGNLLVSPRAEAESASIVAYHRAGKIGAFFQPSASRGW
jgi:hypothetical protein